MIVGFDFDNTIINYTKSFKRLAKKKKLVPDKFNKDKNSIRDYLRKIKKESEWTILQGEIYGSHIMDAEIYNGVNEIMALLVGKNIKLNIVSHKTKFPYLGEKIDLRQSALKWIEKNIFKDLSSKNFSIDNVYFENSIKEKVRKIKYLKCDIFIDDLPEVLSLLPNNIQKILFSPTDQNTDFVNFQVMKSWKELGSLIDFK